MTTLVLGASGFIGSAVMRQFGTGAYGPAIGFVRTVEAAQKLRDAGNKAALGTLNDTASLRRAMRQARSVISCVSYVGSDEDRCLEVNQHGMRNVAAIAAELGVQRLVYVSTAAVYGPGPFRGTPVKGAPLRPRSAASRTRAVAEGFVLDVGGTVLRPHLVYGPGDQWFWPGVQHTLDRLGHTLDEGSALHSTIHVDSLAAAVANLALDRHAHDLRIYHVNAPIPLSLADIVTMIEKATGWNAPGSSITLADALRYAPALGLDGARLTLLGQDHWFQNTLFSR